MNKNLLSDSEGNLIALGDWVAFEMAPASLLSGLPVEDQQAIECQVDKPLEIAGFDENGNVELEWKEEGDRFRTVWIDPKHIVKVVLTSEALTVTGTKKSRREKKWRDKIAEAWVKMSKSLRVKEPNTDDWASSLMYEMVSNRPEEAWIIIDAIRNSTDDLQVLAHLAASHLEDLLSEHGEKFIHRFELQAQRDTDFRHMLGGVWQSNISDEVWERVKAIALPPKWK